MTDILVEHNYNYVLMMNISRTVALYKTNAVVMTDTVLITDILNCDMQILSPLDKIDNFKLFRKFLDRKTPIAIVRLFLFYHV